MRKTLLLLPVALLALSACGRQATERGRRRQRDVTGDSNTMGEAVSDVNAAECRVPSAGQFTEAENQLRGQRRTPATRSRNDARACRYC